MAVLLLFGSTSKEFVHAFAGHEDTVHHEHGGGLHIDQQHHHCAFLSFELTPFQYEPFQYVFPFYQEHFTTHEAGTVTHLCDRPVVYQLLRGPPAFV